MKLASGLAAILLGTLHAQQPASLPPGAPATPINPKDFARLEGRTLSSAGQPLRKTNLTLRPVNGRSGEAPKAPYATTSDAEGRFVFEAIEPGQYQLSADRQGYLRQAYGAKPSSMQGTQLTLAAGQEMKDLTLQLTPHSVISGKVLDEDGDPVAGAQVMVMRQAYMNGKRQMMPSGGGMSDESGEFKVSNLGPGRYYLSALPVRRNMFGEQPRSGALQADKPQQDYITTYYPGVVDLPAAMPVEVAAGRNVSGMDITIRKSAVFKVRGKVIGTVPNQSAQQLRVTVMPRDSFLGFMGNNSSANIGKDGSFELSGVPRGSFLLAAVKAQGMLQILARQPIDISNGDLDGLVLTLQPFGDLHGIVKIEGELKAANATSQTNTPQQALSARISLTASDGPAMNQPSASVSNDGTFVVPNVGPGKYRVNVFATPDGTYVKSVLLENQEVLAAGLDLTQGPGAGTLQVILSANAGQIDGTVTTDNQQSTQGAMVTLLPEPPQPDQTYLYRSSTADQSGHFVLKNLPPGNYRLYAWEDLEFGSQYDPDFIKPHESQGVPVKIGAGGHEQVTVARIPSARVEEAKQK